MAGVTNWVGEIQQVPWAVLQEELPWILLAIGGLYAVLYLVDMILRPEGRSRPQEGKEPLPRSRKLL